MIRLEGLRLQAFIGIYAHEQTSQPLEIDLSLTIHGALAAHTDDIRHTVDYDEVVNVLEELLASRHFNLLEHLSQVMLEVLGSRFPIKRAEITLAKPLAAPKARRVSVSRQAEWPSTPQSPIPQPERAKCITQPATSIAQRQIAQHSHSNTTGFIP